MLLPTMGLLRAPPLAQLQDLCSNTLRVRIQLEIAQVEFPTHWRSVRMDGPVTVRLDSRRESHRYRYRISNIEYRISNIEYRISNIEYRISNIKYRISNIEYRISNIESQILSCSPSLLHSYYNRLFNKSTRNL
jgi:hypothetical protein